MDIPGLNPWNILLAIVCLAWFLQRRREGLVWDMPLKINVLLIMYLSVVLIGFARMAGDLGGIIDYVRFRGGDFSVSAGSLASEYLINTIKWVVPGLLLFDGCRTQQRFLFAFFAVLGVYFLLSVQVIRWMPIESALSGEGLTERSLKILLNEVGYHRVNLSMMLSGASWAVFSSRYLTQSSVSRMVLLVGSLIIVFAQALTGGRTGYGAWIVVGLCLCLLRWRRYLVFAPIGALLIISFVPGVVERMMQGFTAETRDYNVRIHSDDLQEDDPDLYTITAGRNIAWPFVIEKVEESPILGYGRMAMMRTGVALLLERDLGENFPHPHNAYLEWVFDNGILGAIPVFFFYLLVLMRSISLFRDSSSNVYVAVGGATFALVFALLVASIGSQTFYPREGAVGMWCCIGLMLRVYQQRQVCTAPDRSDGEVERVLWQNSLISKPI